MSRELEEAKYLFCEGEVCKLDVVQALDEVFKVPDAGASHKSEEVEVLDALEDPCSDDQEYADKVSNVSIDPDPLDENVMSMEAMAKKKNFLMKMTRNLLFVLFWFLM